MLGSSLLYVAALASTASALVVPARIARSDRNTSPAHAERGLEKRAFNGRATFYDVGLGACGWNNVGSDFIVALNSPQYGGGYPGPNCGKQITIQYGGKTATATIADQCPGCGYGDLDLSRGLFNYFASESLGVFQMTWWFNGEGGGQPAPAPSTTTTTYQAPPPTTQQYQPTTTQQPQTTQQAQPTTTQQPQTTQQAQPQTTQQAAQASSSPTAAPSSSSSSTTVAAASSASASSASRDSTGASVSDIFASQTVSAPSGTSSASASQSAGVNAAANPGNLIMLNQAVAYMGHIIVVGAGGQ